MSTPRCNRKIRHRNNAGLGAIALALLVASQFTFALSTDRDKPMDITADHAKINQGSDKSAGVTYLNGNVRINRGSMKAASAEATIYQHPANARDASGKDISSAVQRVVLIGKPARMEEIGKNGDLVTSTADRIDYNADSAIAELSGNVTVVQQGRSEFHGNHMTYNTLTGEMESGDGSAANRVHMIIQPKTTASKAATGAKPGAQPSKDEQKAAEKGIPS